MSTAGARIEVRDLTKRFGSFTAVDHLNFTVEPGRITGFLGPNGAGKTTTLRMLLGPGAPHRRHGDDRRPALRRHRRTRSRVVGSALEATNFHPGRTGRNHLRVLADTAGVEHRAGRRDARARRASRPRRASGPAATRWACASGSASPPPCWATRTCSSSTSRPTASTPRASAGCAASCATSASQGRTVLISSHMLSEVEQTVDDVVIIANGRLVGRARWPTLHGEPTSVVAHLRPRSPWPAPCRVGRRHAHRDRRARPAAARRRPRPDRRRGTAAPGCRSTSCARTRPTSRTLFFAAHRAAHREPQPQPGGRLPHRTRRHPQHTKGRRR